LNLWFFLCALQWCHSRGTGLVAELGFVESIRSQAHVWLGYFLPGRVLRCHCHESFGIRVDIAGPGQSVMTFHGFESGEMVLLDTLPIPCDMTREQLNPTTNQSLLILVQGIDDLGGGRSYQTPCS
jgi:hypothetical protein